MAEIKKSSMYIELFEPDATRSDFTPAGNAADALCQQIETADLLEKMTDCTNAMKAVAPAPAPGPTSHATVRTPLDKLISAFVMRTVDAIHKVPLRRQTIVGIINKTRNRPELKSIRDSDGWDRLANSCVAYVTQAVISEVK